MSASTVLPHIAVMKGSGGKTYLALQVPNDQARQDLSCFVAVPNVFEGLGGVLPADVEEDFFAASVVQFISYRWGLASEAGGLWGDGRGKGKETYGCSSMKELAL
jgi:hypothetical protein